MGPIFRTLLLAFVGVPSLLLLALTALLYWAGHPDEGRVTLFVGLVLAMATFIMSQPALAQPVE